MEVPDSAEAGWCSAAGDADPHQGRAAKAPGQLWWRRPLLTLHQLAAAPLHYLPVNGGQTGCSPVNEECTYSLINATFSSQLFI
jgi:hypothetical protein